MKRKISSAFLLFIMILNQACIVPHHSFVATSFEPVTVKKKGDLEVSASIRHFKFFKANATMAVNNWLALRAGYSGFYQLDNFDASVILFKNYEKLGVYVAPTYNYQHNVIQRNYGFSFYGIGRNFKYNCEYHSPGIVLGLSRFSKKGNTHQLILKSSYNIVSRYDYYFSSNTASGRDSGFYIKDDETLSYNIPNFFSFEPSYCLVISRPYRRMAFRFQYGFNICQQVLIHHYSFLNGAYGSPQRVEATNLHPVFFPFNVSVGLIFKHNFKKKTAEES